MVKVLGRGTRGWRHALLHNFAAAAPPPSARYLLSLESEGRQTLKGGRRGTIRAETRTTHLFLLKMIWGDGDSSPDASRGTLKEAVKRGEHGD